MCKGELDFSMYDYAERQAERYEEMLQQEKEIHDEYMSIVDFNEDLICKYCECLFVPPEVEDRNSKFMFCFCGLCECGSMELEDECNCRELEKGEEK